MAYSKNPQLPRVRWEAVRLVKYQGWSVRKAARHFGFTHGAVERWLKRQPVYDRDGQLIIPTLSSRPRSHPASLSNEIKSRILILRSERNQCAEILHHRLIQEDVEVSLSSVKRVLKRCGISRFSKWKKWHQYPPRPMAEKPGILVEIDTMMDGVPKDRLSLYAGIDVCSRWGFALPTKRVNCWKSLDFVLEAGETSPFIFQTLQTDHGSEFSKWFTKQLICCNIHHRHSRVRKPTDNSHVERFIQTLQRECLNRIPKTMKSWQKEIPEYLRYYNEERPHMALQMKTPQQWLQAID
jgi:transposase InsO family protein